MSKLRDERFQNEFQKKLKQGSLVIHVGNDSEWFADIGGGAPLLMANSPGELFAVLLTMADDRYLARKVEDRRSIGVLLIDGEGKPLFCFCGRRAFECDGSRAGCWREGGDS